MAATYPNSRVVLWEVDTQADFMLPGGKLYVPGAEKRIPNMRKLVEAARAGKALLISSTDQHAPDDPEFQRFPPHCVRGTSGAEIVPELKARDSIHVKNSSTSAVPASVSAAQQVIIEKQTLDVFDNPATEKLLTHLPTDCEFILFGVVTELCVRFAAKGLLDRGRRVALVTDAIEALDAKEGKNALNEVEERGARLLTTNEALTLIEQSSNRSQSPGH
jgi:nicotinamidase/pyrazinamidase